MTKINQNFTMSKGDDKVIEFPFDDISDFTGCTAEWGFANTKDDLPILRKLSTSNPPGITFSGNMAKVIINAEDTDYTTAINPGNYYHELILIDSVGDDSKSSSGTMTLEHSILRKPV